MTCKGVSTSADGSPKAINSLLKYKYLSYAHFFQYIIQEHLDFLFYTLKYKENH